jgi:hypothetical protein
MGYMENNRIYWKVLGMHEYLLGYTSCKKTYLKECIKEGWAKNQLTFIKQYNNE